MVSKTLTLSGAHSSVWIEWLPAEQLVEGSSPSGPASILSLYLGPTCIIIKIRKLFNPQETDPMTTFIYALRAPDTRRQYPRRFKFYLDFLKTQGTIAGQAKQFILKARDNPQWAQESLMLFIDTQKERARR